MMRAKDNNMADLGAIVRAVDEETARIVARIRSRATSEDVTADRQSSPVCASQHRMAAHVLRDEADRLEKGV